MPKKQPNARSMMQFWGDDDGATAIEYALIAMLVSMLVVSGATAIGLDLIGIFTLVNAGFSSK